MMKATFDPIAYVNEVGQELVSSFERASFATTPGQIGSAKEVPVREKLEQILPRGLAIGTGCVIDSFGGTSNQIDVIVYEKDFCPVFCINQDSSVAFYPCEGVIAVGEIKSSLSSRDLKDAFIKISSVKRLRRFTRSSIAQATSSPKDSVVFRKYGSMLSAQGSKTEGYDQDANPLDQIYGFVFAGTLTLSPPTLCERFAGLTKETGFQFGPNLVVTLNGDILCPIQVPENRHNPAISVSSQTANYVYHVQNQENSFQFLLSMVYSVYRTGRTVEAIAFDRYLARDGLLTLPENGYTAKLDETW